MIRRYNIVHSRLACFYELYYIYSTLVRLRTRTTSHILTKALQAEAVASPIDVYYSVHVLAE